jgi:hypothetical protein
VIWSKPNGLPESVQDRVRRSHEQWFHFTREPRYFSAVDEIREPHGDAARTTRADGDNTPCGHLHARLVADNTALDTAQEPRNQPPRQAPRLRLDDPDRTAHRPRHLGVDHFAAFPMEWPRRIIQGWSPAGICVECGEGRRPVSRRERRATL